MSLLYSALNYCDIAPMIANLANKQANFCHSFPSFENCRFYLGSYTCPNYFLKTNHEAIFKNIVEQCDAKVTLVIPVCNQSSLQKVKQNVSDLMDRYGKRIDEFTLNDYGALSYYPRAYPGIKINAGRLLFKEPRDLRIDLPINAELSTDYVISATKQALVLTPLSAVELDTDRYDFLRFKSAFNDIVIRIHTPFRFVTQGAICKYASISLEPEKKFRPGSPCNMECMRFAELVPITSKDSFLLRLGRAVYGYETASTATREYPAKVEKVELVYSPYNELFHAISESREAQ